MEDNPFNIQEGFCRIFLFKNYISKQILFPDEIPFFHHCDPLSFFIQKSFSMMAHLIHAMGENYVTVLRVRASQISTKSAVH